MADITALNPSPLFVDEGHTFIRTGLAGAGGVSFGQSVYLDPTTGTFLPTDGTSSTKVAFRGIVIEPALGAGAGQAVGVVENGYVAGFDLTSLAYDALVYLSNTVGKLSTTAGTNSSTVGRVASLSDRDPVTNKPSKILYIRPSAV